MLLLLEEAKTPLNPSLSMILLEVVFYFSLVDLLSFVQIKHCSNLFIFCKESYHFDDIIKQFI